MHAEAAEAREYLAGTVPVTSVGGRGHR
jgi:hypothetical protein